MRNNSTKQKGEKNSTSHRLACVAWRFWLGALIKAGGQRNREEIGAIATYFSRGVAARAPGSTKLPCYAGYRLQCLLSLWLSWKSLSRLWETMRPFGWDSGIQHNLLWHAQLANCSELAVMPGWGKDRNHLWSWHLLNELDIQDGLYNRKENS